MLSLPRAWVQFLVGKLRSHMLYSTAKTKVTESPSSEGPQLASPDLSGWAQVGFNPNSPQKPVPSTPEKGEQASPRGRPL